MDANLTLNYPEMHGEIECDVQAEYSAIVNKYRVVSKSIIPQTMGIKFDSVVDRLGANNQPNKRVGWFKYYMTKKAFDKFLKTNKVVQNILLD